MTIIAERTFNVKAPDEPHKLTTPMLRYWIFEIPTYYPAGGMDDFVAQASTIEEAEAFCKNRDVCMQIFDTQEGRIV